ncbi:MAG: phage holin family protein [Oscillospiraceae bacterium]|nr:phage holin family protein [Oscillospiraceae bacterium]
MRDTDKIKIAFVAVFTAVNGWLGALAVPFYFLLLTNIIDYATGIVAAVCRGERVSSNIGFKGIAKKVCMWLLVLAGHIVDFIIVEMGHTMQIEFGLNCLVALAVIFWLLANELISILENISDIGTPLPPFLTKLVEMVKEKSEDSVLINEDK